MDVVSILTIVIPVVSVVVSHFLNRRKLNAEIARMEEETRAASEKLKLENNIAVTKARTDKDEAEAKTDRFIADTALSAVDRLSARLEIIEKQYDESRAKVERERLLHTKEIDKLNGEISVLKEQLKTAIIEREAAEAKLAAAMDLARRYRLVASDLYHQLIDEHLVPRHVLEDCDDMDARK
jgi:SMC interacting uncharacterized protein involved in chromosome segregation